MTFESSKYAELADANAVVRAKDETKVAGNGSIDLKVSGDDKAFRVLHVDGFEYQLLSVSKHSSKDLRSCLMTVVFA